MNNKFTISLYGGINTGKSSIVNALLGRAVAITSSKGGATIDSSEHMLPDTLLTDAALGLYIIDSPGISEVGGECRAQGAFDSAYKSDLIVFVIESDLTEVEYDAFRKLHEAGKPIVVALNKVDQLSTSQLKSISNAIMSKLNDQIDPENFIQITAAPLRRFMIEKEGAETIHEEPSKPNIEPLINRIVEIANDEGIELIKLNEILHQFEMDKQKIKKDMEHKKNIAEVKIFNFSVGTAIGIAINPIPWIDIAGGAVSLERLVSNLAEIYDIEIDGNEALEIGKMLWKEGKGTLGVSVAAVFFGSALKSIPFIGTVTGATIQGGSVGYLVYVTGMLASEYYENGRRWAEGRSMHEALDDIVSNIDKKKLTAKIIAEIKDQYENKEGLSNIKEDAWQINDLQSKDEVYNEFLKSLCSMLVKLANADASGQVTVKNMNCINDLIEEELNLDTENINRVKELLQSALIDDENNSIYVCAYKLKRSTEDMIDMRKLAYRILLKVAFADGDISPIEENILRKLPKHLGLSSSSYNILKEEFLGKR